MAAAHRVQCVDSARGARRVNSAVHGVTDRRDATPWAERRPARCVRQRGGPSPTVCETPTKGTPMKRLLLATTFAWIAGTAALSLAALTTRVEAADMSGEMKGFSGLPTIWFTGNIEKGDFEKFVKWLKAVPGGAKQWGGLVAIESPGGLIMEALAIGELIRKLNWGVVTFETCASACALIWVAGSKRGAFADSHIGFHSAYDAKTGEVSGGSNALVGAYLSKL